MISYHQLGFRKYHSCESGLASLLSEWHKCIDKNHMEGCINIGFKNLNVINVTIINLLHGSARTCKIEKQSVYIDGCTSQILKLQIY